MLTRENYSAMLTLGIASSSMQPQTWGNILCSDLLTGYFANWASHGFANFGIRLDTTILIFCPTFIFVWY